MNRPFNKELASSGERGKAGTNKGQLLASGMGVAGMSISGGPRVMTPGGGRKGTLVTSGIKGRSPKGK